MSQEENQKMPPVGGETPSPASEAPAPERKPSRSRPVKGCCNRSTNSSKRSCRLKVCSISNTKNHFPPLRIALV